MKKSSVKWKLSIWITILMLVLVAGMLVVLMSATSSVLTNSAYEQLETTLRSNLAGISRAENGSLVFADYFSFTRSGVYTLVYSQQGALLAGQPPLNAPDDEPFENGLLRPVDSGDETYYVMDFYLRFSWEDGVWVRGVMQAPEASDLVDAFTGVALSLLLLAVVLGGAGAYLLVRSAFRPLDRIVAAAEAIGEGRDLSRRIGLPPGRDEISRLATAFDGMFERLERSFEAEQQFTSDASHELRTPTAVILAQCAEARNHARTPEQYDQAITVIDRQARKMSALISQLLQMTRLEQGTLRATMEEADLSELTEILCQEQPELPRGITLQTDIQPEIRAVFDVTLVTRLLQNLLDNAARYGRDGGHIWVELRKRDHEILLSVRDDGIGIPKDQQEKIFQRFYQADASRSGSGGAGLGLTMVRQIAALHGGRITLESVEGVGSRFTFHLPVKSEE